MPQAQLRQSFSLHQQPRAARAGMSREKQQGLKQEAEKNPGAVRDGWWETANGGGGSGSAFSHCVCLQVPCFVLTTIVMFPSHHILFFTMIRRTGVENLKAMLYGKRLVWVPCCILEL